MVRLPYGGAKRKIVTVATFGKCPSGTIYFRVESPRAGENRGYRLFSHPRSCYNKPSGFAAHAHLRSIPEEIAMDEASLEGALNDLAKQFGEGVDFSHSKLASLAKQAEANRKQLQKSINTLQELLDYLRVCIKYQAFDLEATRRENTYLRKLLEDNSREEGGPPNA